MHWKRSALKVSTRVCETSASLKVFKYLADKVTTCQAKQEVQAIFNVLSGDRPLSSVKNVLPEDMKKEEIDNASWTKLQNWKKWWTREEHLSKFTFSFPRLNDNFGNCICNQLHSSQHSHSNILCAPAMCSRDVHSRIYSYGEKLDRLSRNDQSGRTYQQRFNSTFKRP